MSLGTRLFVTLQYLLPQHGISRLVLLATRVRRPWFKNLLIRGFLKLYAVDLREAAEPDPFAYPSFNEFFTRALRTDARPLPVDSRTLASPCDGTVSQCGKLAHDRLLQAKGRDYSLADLLADERLAPEFVDGSFATLYLAPYNYHRVHMPLDGVLRQATHIPGRLFSVNAATAAAVPRLFARNERIVCLFDTAIGPVAVILVGALNVGSMGLVWAGDVTPRPGSVASQLPQPAPAPRLAQGAELGRFNMGSTVILLLPPGQCRWHAGLVPGRTVRVNEGLAELTGRS